MFRTNPHIASERLCLHFYMDEFEVINPLDSKRGKHKMTAVYFKLGNPDRKETSKLQNIYLSVLVHHHFLQNKLTDYAEVLQPLIVDIQTLETSGVLLSCDGESKLCKGTMVSLSADNLSAHALAGFSRCFSSGRICHFCMATVNELVK